LSGINDFLRSKWLVPQGATCFGTLLYFAKSLSFELLFISILFRSPLTSFGRFSLDSGYISGVPIPRPVIKVIIFDSIWTGCSATTHQVRHLDLIAFDSLPLISPRAVDLEDSVWSWVLQTMETTIKENYKDLFTAVSMPICRFTSCLHDVKRRNPPALY
jgi:hypothetical protein